MYSFFLIHLIFKVQIAIILLRILAVPSAIANSCPDVSDNEAVTTLGPDVGAPNVETLTDGAIQGTKICKNPDKDCKKMCDKIDLVPCCYEDDGVKYCSCKDGPNDVCPDLVYLTSVQVRADLDTTGLLSALDRRTASLHGRGDIYETDQLPEIMPIEYSMRDDCLTIRMAVSSPIRDSEVLVTRYALNFNGVDEIVKIYLKNLTADAMVKLLDRDIVEQIARKVKS